VTEALPLECLRDFLQNRRRMSHIYERVRRAKTEPNRPAEEQVEHEDRLTTIVRACLMG
jgi:hypothetical protein